MEGKYATSRKEALAFKRELEQIKKKATVDRKIHQLANEDVVLVDVTDDSKKRAQSICAGTLNSGRKPAATSGGVRSIKSHDDATKLLLVANQVPKPPKEPNPRKGVLSQSSRPSHLSKVNSQQSGVELQRKSYVKKETSNQQFAIAGACNTTAPVQLSQRPIPPARKPLNLPTASAKEVEEKSSDIASLPQHLKSRPTTRGSMQTSEGMSKSSFQQYILATADYMHTSSEPFSVTSGSPLSSHIHSQTPGKQMPLRVQSLPNFASYVSGETLEGDQLTADGYLEQREYEDSNTYGRETALGVPTKKQNRALKLEVDLRVVTSLTSTDTAGEGAPIETDKTEQSDKPTSTEVPSVNVLPSVSPSQSYPSYPETTVQPKDEHAITVVHSDGIYWASREPFATIPCVDSSSLAVSDTASQTSSALTLKDDDISHQQPYSESLYDDQSTAERSLLYEQDDSLMSSSNKDAYMGLSPDNSIHADNIQPDVLLKIQTIQHPSCTSEEESANPFSSGSPGHLTYPTSDVTPAGDESTAVGSGITPASQQSHNTFSSHYNFLSIPTLEETSASAPTILYTADSTMTSNPSPEHSYQLPSDLTQADGSHSSDYDTTPVLTEHLTDGEHPLEHDDRMEDTLTSDIHEPCIVNGSANVTTLPQDSVSPLPIEQKDSESLSTTLPPTTSISTQEQSSNGDVLPSHNADNNETLLRASTGDERSSQLQDDLQLTVDSGLTDHSKDEIPEIVPLVLTRSSSQLEGEGQALVESEVRAKALRITLSTEKVMEKLLNNQASDIPAQSLAEFLAYTDKPVTLADIISIKGESLMPPTLQLSDKHSLDGDEQDIERSQDDQTTTLDIPTTASAKERPVSVGKKKVTFLSEWPQEKEQDFVLKQLVQPSPRNSIHHFCAVPESPQLPHKLQILSCKTHAQPRDKVTAHQEQNISTPPATPVLDERTKQADQVVVTSTSIKRSSTPVPSVDDSSTGMFVEGKPVNIIKDASSLLWKPAPAKLSLFPSTVKSHLFPHYHGLSTAHSAGQGKVTIMLPSEADTASHGVRKSSKTGQASLAFRSLIDFSKYDVKDIPKLVPFYAPSASPPPATSSGSSDSSSYVSGTKCATETVDSESIRSTIDQSVITESDYEGVQVNVVAVSDDDTDSSKEEDEQHGGQRVTSRIRYLPRSNTLPDVEELEAVSKYTEKQISKLYQQDDEVSTTVSSAISDSGTSKRHTVSMPNILHAEAKEENTMDYDDFTNTMAELEKQKKHLAAYYGHSEQTADSDAECLSGTTDLESVFLRDERQMQRRQRRFRPAHTRPGRSGKQKAVTKRTKSALARAREARRLLSQPARNLRRSASFPLFNGNTDSIEIQPPSSDYQKSRRLSDTVYHDFSALAQSYGQRLSTEKECYKWADQLWDEWFEEAYAESKAELEMLQPHSSISFFASSKSKLQLTRDDSRVKEPDEYPKILELQNIDKTVFDDEATVDSMRSKVEQLSADITKATTVETRAVYLCRRGALLRKLGRFIDAKDDLDKAIAMVPQLIDAHWHRHCLFIVQNDPMSAMAELDTILGLHRRHVKAYRSKAMLIKDSGDLKEALFYLSQAVILDKKNKTLYNQRAMLYEQKGAIESAIEDYQTMVDIDPSDSSAILKMGMHHFNKKMWSAASQNFTLLVERDASNTTARIHRAQTQWKLGNYVQALQDLSAAIHLDPNNAAAYYHRACLLRVRHPHKALQDYSTSLLLDSTVNNVMAYLHRGILYTSINCYIDAIPDFEAAIKLDNKVACFHVCLGLTYLLHSKQYQRAVNCFTASVQADPTYVRAYVCRAEAYQQMNKLKKALLDYVRASHIQPDEGSYLLYKGYLLLLMNKLDLAHAHISTASKMGACLAQETAHKASLDSFLGNHDEAIRELEIAVRSKPSPQMFMLLGRTCQNAGDHAQAIKAFDRAIEATEMRSHGSSPLKPSLMSQIHHLCGTSHTELGHYQDAIDHLNEAVHHVPTNALAYYQRGIAKLKSGNNKGILDLNRALAINPTMYEVFLTRACYFSANGRYTKAILNCNQAIQLQPQSVRAYLYRGSLKYYTNQYKSAIEDLTTAVSLDRQCSLVYFNRALCQQALGNTEKAIADYSTVLLIKEEPSYEGPSMKKSTFHRWPVDHRGLKNYIPQKFVLINRGLLYLTMEEYGSALMDMIDAGKLYPKNSSIFQAIGLCYHRLGELQLSIEAYDQAIVLDNFFIEAYIGRGNVQMDYLTPGRIIMSKADYCKALHFDPCCLPARVNLAYTLQMEEKYQRSWNHFTCALVIDPNYVPALEGRAVINLQMGNLFGSFLDISSAIRISPTAELYTNRGVIHQFMGKGMDAMRDYEMALKLNSHYGLAYFNIGNIYFHHRQFQQAADTYTEALEISPDDDSYLLNRAITRSLLKDYDGALGDFKASIEINPSASHAYFNRGNLYKSYQQYSLAEEDYKTALSLSPDDQVCMQYCAEVLGKQGKREEALKYFENQLDHK